MSYVINFFGWCSEDNHDKVWGFVTVQGDEIYNFWGRRGKKIAFQRQEGSAWASAFTLQRKAEEKCRSGRRNGAYQDIPISKIEEVCPGFHEEFELQLFYAKLANNFRHKREDEDV